MGREPDDLDLSRLINEAADDFEQQFQVSVTKAARNALIAPALKHHDEVVSELSSGSVSVADLRRKVIDQLKVAKRVADRQHPKRAYARIEAPVHIGSKEALQSMKEECSYAFWC